MDEETPPTPADAEAALDALGLHALTGTPLGLELERLRAGERWCIVTVAGLQFYCYGRWDDVLDRLVIPERGDRLALMRRPENPQDQHAVEIWWRDGHQLGHVPRGLAAELAPQLDAGAACRAYVLDPGDGEAWSLRALLVGPAAGPLHRQEITAGLRRAVAAASDAVWGQEHWGIDSYAEKPGGLRPLRFSPRSNVPVPTERQRAAADTWKARRRAARDAREAAAIYAFHLAPEPRPTLPEGADGTPDEALRGQTLPWWDQVPPWLTTKSKLAGFGLRPRPEAAPFAAIEYGRGRRWRHYELWAVADCEPKRIAPAEAGARAAEAAFWRRPEVEARRAEQQEARAAAARRRRRGERGWEH